MSKIALTKKQSKDLTYLRYEFARRLATMRKAKKLNQKELATAAGVSANVVSSYENGESLPSVLVLMSLCRVLGCTTARLVPVK